ncbi:MAG: hypothetical protein HYV75_08610 [Opitutae bacterium]|nr:hypothetical protein [Opitutae bacterium]
MKAITVRLSDQQAARFEEIAALCQLAPESLLAVLALGCLAASDDEPNHFEETILEEAAQFITKGDVPGSNICRWLRARRKRLDGIRTAAVRRRRGAESAARSQATPTHAGDVLQFIPCPRQ